TDNSQTSGFVCNNGITPQRTSVIEILGQGWRDAALASVVQLGIPIPLCPIYYSGIWCIRCCSEDAFPAYYTMYGAGCPGTLPVSQLLPATLPRIGTTMFVIVNNLPLNLGLMISGTSNTNSGFGPLPLNVAPLGMPGCFLRASFDFTTVLTGGGNSASYSLTIPNVNTLLGQQFYQQAFVFDQVNVFGGVLSNASALQIGN
ncbi:MAG: hypothetical protein ABIP94_19010, partial [Planctomycetota bacterium]